MFIPKGVYKRSSEVVNFAHDDRGGFHILDKGCVNNFYQTKRPRLVSGLFFAHQFLLIMHPVVLSFEIEFILHCVSFKY